MVHLTLPQVLQQGTDMQKRIAHDLLKQYPTLEQNHIFHELRVYCLCLKCHLFSHHLHVAVAITRIQPETINVRSAFIRAAGWRWRSPYCFTSDERIEVGRWLQLWCPVLLYYVILSSGMYRFIYTSTPHMTFVVECNYLFS
jgi:hypothetical protein